MKAGYNGQMELYNRPKRRNGDNHSPAPEPIVREYSKLTAGEGVGGIWYANEWEYQGHTTMYIDGRVPKERLFE